MREGFYRTGRETAEEPAAHGDLAGAEQGAMRRGREERARGDGGPEARRNRKQQKVKSCSVRSGSNSRQKIAIQPTFKPRE